MNFMGAYVCGSVAGQRSFVQIHNPANSGVDVYVASLLLSWNAVAGVLSSTPRSGYDLRRTSMERGTFARNFHSKDFSIIQKSAAQLRWGNCEAQYLPADEEIVYEPWEGLPLDDRVYDFRGPMILPPGFGMAACAAHDNTYSILSAQIVEVPCGLIPTQFYEFFQTT